MHMPHGKVSASVVNSPDLVHQEGLAHKCYAHVCLATQRASLRRIHMRAHDAAEVRVADAVGVNGCAAPIRAALEIAKHASGRGGRSRRCQGLGDARVVILVFGAAVLVAGAGGRRALCALA